MPTRQGKIKGWTERKTNRYIHDKLREWWDKQYPENTDQKAALSKKFNEWHSKGVKTSGTFE